MKIEDFYDNVAYAQNEIRALRAIAHAHHSLFAALGVDEKTVTAAITKSEGAFHLTEPQKQIVRDILNGVK